MAKYVNENVAQAIANDIQKNRVLLGAFDTVDTSNANYNLISRNGKQVDLSKLNWEYQAQDVRYESRDIASFVKITGGENANTNLFCSNYIPAGTGASGTIFVFNRNGYLYVYDTNPPTGILQFELVDNLKYTEKVIKGVPILNLDQSGANWLRSEWEKQLNLANDIRLTQTYSDHYGYRVATQLPKGTYTLVVSGTSQQCKLWTLEHSGVSFYGSITFTTTQTLDIELSVYDMSYTTPIFMLVEGNHAYPYQPYNGAIVHEKDLDSIKTNITDLQSNLSDLSNEVDEHSDLLAELKSLVYDNQYPAVKTIKFNTFQALPNSIDGDSLIFGAGSDMTNIDGMSVVVNQLVPNDKINATIYNGTIIGDNLSISNHTFYIHYESEGVLYINFLDSGDNRLAQITDKDTIASVSGTVAKIIVYTSGGIDTTNFHIVDLTQWFGSNDNIPSDLLSNPSLFTSKYWKGSPDYDTGHIESAKPKAVVSKGFNIWDEEWELGSINGDNGENVSYDQCIRSKNYIRVSPNSTYYFKIPNGNFATICYYDKNKNFISSEAYSIANSTITVPNNAYYLRFRTSTGYGTTYNHDICINISNSAINGTYQPHIAPKRYPISVGTDNSVNGVNTIKDIMGVLNTDRKIGKYTFTGSESWSLQRSGTAGDVYAISNLLPVGKGSTSDLLNQVMCSNGYYNPQGGIYAGSSLGIGFDGRTCYICIPSGSNPNTIFASGVSMIYNLHPDAYYTEENSQDAILPTNIEIQKGGSFEIESDLPCDITLEVAVSKVY